MGSGGPGGMFIDTVCGLDNCQFVYNCVETFRKHVTNLHSVHWLGNASRVVSCPDLNRSCDAMYQSLADGDEFNESDEDVETAMDIENAPLFLRISYILQYLGLWLLCGTIHASTSYLAHFDVLC